MQLNIFSKVLLTTIGIFVIVAIGFFLEKLPDDSWIIIILRIIIVFLTIGSIGLILLLLLLQKKTGDGSMSWLFLSHFLNRP